MIENKDTKKQDNKVIQSKDNKDIKSEEKEIMKLEEDKSIQQEKNKDTIQEPEEQIKAAFNQLDSNNDGKISYDEFKTLFQNYLTNYGKK